MADLLSDAHHHAQAARAAVETHLDEHVLTDLRRRYLGAYTAGIRDNHNPLRPPGQGRRRVGPALPRPPRHDPALRGRPRRAFTNNQAERDLRPVRIQQRTGRGTWRTLAGLADFAVVQSDLSTAGGAEFRRRLRRGTISRSRHRSLRTARAPVSGFHDTRAGIIKHTTDDRFVYPSDRRLPVAPYASG